jgi:hypothetical protein
VEGHLTDSTGAKANSSSFQVQSTGGSESGVGSKFSFDQFFRLELYQEVKPPFGGCLRDSFVFISKLLQ